ncbi:karyopherin beta [Nowakowskiella sp. JEL0407]|nr:karyopherin beta [Nowakowskiella sp. JEL0407]
MPPYLGNERRAVAEKQIEGLRDADFLQFVNAICTELVNEVNEEMVRCAAGLLLKNSLTAPDPATRAFREQKWRELDFTFKTSIKNALLSILATPAKQVALTVAQIITTIAIIELPNGEWPDLIDSLLNNIDVVAQNNSLKEATLNTIGYICESLEQEGLDSLDTTQASKILTAVCQGAHPSVQVIPVQLAALKALSNSIAFIRANFQVEGERNYVMQIVCEATQSKDADVKESAFECLVKIIQYYYDQMELYMTQALVPLTFRAMSSEVALKEDTRVVHQAIEFWSTICEIEFDIDAQNEDLASSGMLPSRHNFMFSANNITTLLPMLLWLLAQKDADDDEDEWNIPMAAGTCLTLLAATVKEKIVPGVLAFVKEHFASEDWRYQEAAMYAYGSILDGPDPSVLRPIVEDSIMHLITKLDTSTVIQVKDTTAWALGRITTSVPEATESNLTALLTVIVKGFNESQRVPSYCAWCVINLAEHFGNPDDATYPLSPLFGQLIQQLLAAADSPVTPERQKNYEAFRAAAYEAVATLVKSCAKDCIAVVRELASFVLQKLDQSIEQQASLVNYDDRAKHSEHQSNLCCVLTAILGRLGHDKEIDQALANNTMTVLLKLIHTALKNSTVLEDVFLAVSALTHALESSFIVYYGQFEEHLLRALSNHEEYQLCAIAVGLVGDICRALNAEISPGAGKIMEVLLQGLLSPVLPQHIKPKILSSFGDVANAIGDHFDLFFEKSMKLLEQASQTEWSPDNYQQNEYGNELREGVIDGYVGIVQGLRGKSPESFQKFSPYLEGIFTFLHKAATDPQHSREVVKGVVGLLGDMADIFPNGSLIVFYSAPWIDPFFAKVKEETSAEDITKDVLKWARSKVKKQRA